MSGAASVGVQTLRTVAFLQNIGTFYGRSEKAKAKQVIEVSEGGTVRTSPASHFSEAGTVEKYKGPNGTVGAVAVDTQGNMAAATSTGGMTNKMPGRVGDTAVVGAVRFLYSASAMLI